MRPFDLFFDFYHGQTDGRTNRDYYLIEMQFYISAMNVGFPDEIHKEKASFLDFDSNWLLTDGRTGGWADVRTDSHRDTRTHS